MLSLLAFSLLCSAAQAQSGPFTLTQTNAFAGPTFFDGFSWNASEIDYFNCEGRSADSNWVQGSESDGNIHYVAEAVATDPANPLTYINAAGNAIIRADNVTSGVGDPTFGRNSVNLISKDAISLGSLTVIDA
jgi:hypothetical protein